jgi:tetratricopeptide (TPR) repeat protein
MGFFALFAFEILIFGFFFPFFTHSSFTAVILGAFALSLFTYFVIWFYFQTKKPLELNALQERFLESCRQVTPSPQGAAEHHLSIAQSALRLISHLQDLEYTYYQMPSWLKLSSLWARKISHFFHHEDVFLMKEKLLQSAVDEHVEQIKITPTDLEVHASLANVYVLLAKLYSEGKKEEEFFPLFPKRKEEAVLEKKFQFSAQRAIEELKILSDYAPNDPWVHAQLAQCYRTLEKKEAEAEQYEKMIRLSPSDNEMYFRLGILYFELGYNSKGLRVFEELKKRHYQKISELLSYYGSAKPLVLEE